jgi:hypothetical protein
MTNKVKNQYFFGVFHTYSLGWTEQMGRQPHVPITLHELNLNWRLGQKCSEDLASNAGSAPGSEGKDKSSIPFGIPHHIYPKMCVSIGCSLKVPIEHMQWCGILKELR